MQFFSTSKHALWKKTLRINLVISNSVELLLHSKTLRKTNFLLIRENKVKNFLQLFLNLNSISKLYIKNVFDSVAIFLKEFLLIKRFAMSHLEALSEEILIFKKFLEYFVLFTHRFFCTLSNPEDTSTIYPCWFLKSDIRIETKKRRKMFKASIF